MNRSRLCCTRFWCRLFPRGGQSRGVQCRRSGRSGGENRRGESAEREDEADFESSVSPIFLGGRVGVFSRVGSVADYHHRVGRAKTRTELPSER